MKDVLNQTPSKPYTDMNSFQLKTLSSSAGFIAHYLFQIMETIADYDLDLRHNEDNHNPAFIKGIIDKKIIRRFNSILQLLVTYVIPLIPKSSSEPNLLQTYLVEWNNVSLCDAKG
jgi:hypothetical protein